MSLRPPSRSGGFTLIEVMAALVVFAFGVILATRLAGALSQQVEEAALRSLVVVTAQEQMTELEAIPFDDLSPGEEVDTVQLRGRTFECVHVVTEVQPRLKELRVSISPVSLPGPRHFLSSYVWEAW